MVTQSQTWFPGKDFPDREKWLAIRATPKPYRSGRLVYKQPGIQRNADGSFFQPARKPLMIGINEAKRKADAKFAARTGATHPAHHGARVEIVRQRHAYYRRMAA